MTMPLIRVGVLTMTPAQFKRALEENLTVSQAILLIEKDKHKYSAVPSPLVCDVEDDSTVTTGDAEDSER